MVDKGLCRMALQIFQYHLLAFAIDSEGQNVGIESLMLQMVCKVSMIKGQGLSILAGTIDHGRDFALTTQAAARTFPQVVTDFGINVEVNRTHCYISS